MTKSAKDRYVLVGVDFGPESVAAAKWAVHSAEARGRDLVIAHAIPLPYGDSPITGDMIDQMMAGAQSLIDEVMSQLVIPPGVTVETVIEEIPPVGLLRRLAERADLVVLGRHHQTLFERMTEGSITSPLAAHAPCPVTVVPAEYAWPDAAGKPVVVALDATTAATTALEFAFDEAALRQVDLVVLHARPLEDLPMTVVDDVVTLAEILAGWKTDRPEVNVRTVILSGEADEVIADASADAGLLIVGRPHQPHLGGWTRSVARAVLRQARCPLAIVPPSPLPFADDRHRAGATSEA
jgi:nucleotide-binding universal stress UspA family protein